METEVVGPPDRNACTEEIDRLQSAAHRMLELLDGIEEGADAN